MKVMTGRDLMIYIIENHLEDKDVIEQGKLIGFMTEEEAAVKFGVGTTTIRVWVNQEKLPGVSVNSQLFIPFNAENPMELYEGKTQGVFSC